MSLCVRVRETVCTANLQIKLLKAAVVIKQTSLCTSNFVSTPSTREQKQTPLDKPLNYGQTLMGSHITVLGLMHALTTWLVRESGMW